MTCTPFGGNGFSGVICSRGRRAPKCSVPGCERPGERECDFEVARKKSGTCDAKVCTGHAHREPGLGPTGEPKEYCPPHHKHAQQQLALEGK